MPGQNPPTLRVLSASQWIVFQCHLLRMAFLKHLTNTGQEGEITGQGTIKFVKFLFSRENCLPDDLVCHHPKRKGF